MKDGSASGRPPHGTSSGRPTWPRRTHRRARRASIIVTVRQNRSIEQLVAFAQDGRRGQARSRKPSGIVRSGLKRKAYSESADSICAQGRVVHSSRASCGVCRDSNMILRRVGRSLRNDRPSLDQRQKNRSPQLFCNRRLDEAYQLAPWRRFRKITKLLCHSKAELSKMEGSLHAHKKTTDLPSLRRSADSSCIVPTEPAFEDFLLGVHYLLSYRS